MYIKITSKLSHAERQRINRQADLQMERGPTYRDAFGRVGSNQPNRYFAMVEDDDYCDEAPDLHNVARAMMVAAGVTFDYELVD